MATLWAASGGLSAPACAEVLEVSLAIQRAVGLVSEARDYVGLRGSDAWLGPARAAYDDRCAVERGKLLSAEDDLVLIRAAIEGQL